jgi:hypothetical protein
VTFIVGGAGHMSDRLGLKRILVAGWRFGLPVPARNGLNEFAGYGAIAGGTGLRLSVIRAATVW